jgi:glycosyltransferase involved in cell wall biosynthesis
MSQCADSPLVSVVLATRNRCDLLERAVNSVNAQTYSNIEVLVVDDGSSQANLDRTKHFLDNLGDRYSLIKQACADIPGRGPSASRNRGLFASKGKYVAFLDDDDEWIDQDNLLIAVSALEETKSDVFFANMQALRAGEVVLADWFPQARELRRIPFSNERDLLKIVSQNALQQILKHHVIHPSQLIVRTELAVAVKGFWEKVNFGEDVDFMYRVLDVTKQLIYREKVVANYRLPTGDSISLSTSVLDTVLQKAFVYQHCRLLCKSPVFRRCARSREAWTYREFSKYAAEHRLRGEPTKFAWQALNTYPTFGGLLNFLSTAFKETVLR